MRKSKSQKKDSLLEQIKSKLDAKENQRLKEILDKAQGSCVEASKNDQVLTMRSTTVRTLEGALATGQVDTKTWDVERWVINKWDVVAKRELMLDGAKATDLLATELWQVKVWFRRKAPDQLGAEQVLDGLRKYSTVARKIPYRVDNSTPRRSLEMCIMDPHYGMRCHRPGSDHAWSLDECEEVYMWAVNKLLQLSNNYFPVEEIVFPFGNDYMHHDSVHHATTAGTPQPEAESYHYVYERGITLAVTAIDRLLEVAPVKIYQIPGNHDRQSSFTLGHILKAYYRNNSNVTVDASSSPYKFHRYGTNLIGYEHGHSVAQVRLAALMANECPKDWSETSYREWHCGDQHRKGSGKPSSFEEQGVSVEYLPGLTPPNEWHRLKSYNWQKRGALAYVWDYHTGPTARLQANLNSYTGRPTGETQVAKRSKRRS